MFGINWRRTKAKTYDHFDKLADELGEMGGKEVIRAREEGSLELYKANPDAESKLSLRRWFPKSKVRVQTKDGKQTVTRERRAVMKDEWGCDGGLVLLRNSFAEGNVTKILARFNSDGRKDLSKGEMTSGDLYRLKVVKEQVLLDELLKRRQNKSRFSMKALSGWEQRKRLFAVESLRKWGSKKRRSVSKVRYKQNRNNAKDPWYKGLSVLARMSRIGGGRKGP